MWRERRLRFGPRVTLPLLFSSLFLFQSGSDRKDIRSSRRCGNVCKRPCLRSYGKRCLRAVGKPTAFPSGRECLFSIGGAAVFHISIALRASYYIRVVFIDLSPEVCYTVGDAVDWCHVPTARRFKGGSNHSPLPDC